MAGLGICDGEGGDLVFKGAGFGAFLHCDIVSILVLSWCLNLRHSRFCSGGLRAVESLFGIGCARLTSTTRRSSVATSPKFNTVGLSGCRSAGLSGRGFEKCARHSLVDGKSGSCSGSQVACSWLCMRFSRNLRLRRMRNSGWHVSGGEI